MTGPGLRETLTQLATEETQAADAAKVAADKVAADKAAASAAAVAGDKVIPDVVVEKPVEGDAAAVAAAAAVAPAPTTLDIEGLPTELRGKTPQEVSDLWNLMRQSLSAAAYTKDTQPVAQPVAQPIAAVEPDEEKTLKELIIDEPEKALAMWAERNYGPMLRNIATSSQESMFISARDTYPDFKEQEPKVRRIIQSLGIGPESITADHITAAFYMAKGISQDSTARSVASHDAASAAANLTETPTPLEVPAAAGKLDDLSSEVAKRMGMDDKSFAQWRDMSDADYNAAHVKVPMAAKDFGRTGKKE